MYRLFSDFPPGLPGVGLLVLRVALAGFLTSEAAAAASRAVLASSADPGPTAYIIVLVVLALLVAVGFLTPIVQVIVMVVESAAILTELFATDPHLLTLTDRQRPLLAIAVALALALIGPGAYSIDGRLFGRREIVVRPRANGMSRKRSSSTRK